MRTPSIAVVLATVVLCASPAVADPPVSLTPKAVSRSGIPYKPDGDDAGPKELVDAIRARRAGGKLLNLDRMLLNSPAFAKGWNTMFGAIRGQLALPGKLREIAIMAIGALNQAEYEWAQHEKEFYAAGGTKDQLAAIKNVSAAANNDKLFTEGERATLALTDEMTRKIKVSDATMKRIRKALPDDQVVELIGTIAGYNMVSRFAVATGLDLE
jgi:alkylhydroperoxidase family enzyme